ncbi:MAG: cytochrome c maturation protein CcmE [Dehalococcoidia bacterium]|nr:cytochrome c maturation protein CcmE [Dehalococcoidia bacterium]
MTKNKKFIIGGVVVLVAVLVLGYVSTMGSIYYYHVKELLSGDSSLADRSLRVGGVLLDNPDKENLTWYFTIKDEITDDVLPVVYSGNIPNTCKVGEMLVIEGQYDAVAGIFKASSIVVKCSSKYVPKT